MAALQQQRGTAEDEQQVESDLVQTQPADEEEMMNEEEEMMNQEEGMMNEEDGMNDEEDWADEDAEEDLEEDEDAGEVEHDDAVEIDLEKYFLEPEQAKHLPREPALPLLAAFSQVRSSLLT
jgi:hypothetical protein